MHPEENVWEIEMDRSCLIYSMSSGQCFQSQISPTTRAEPGLVNKTPGQVRNKMREKIHSPAPPSPSLGRIVSSLAQSIQSFWHMLLRLVKRSQRFRKRVVKWLPGMNPVYFHDPHSGTAMHASSRRLGTLSAKLRQSGELMVPHVGIKRSRCQEPGTHSSKSHWCAVPYPPHRPLLGLPAWILEEEQNDHTTGMHWQSLEMVAHWVDVEEEWKSGFIVVFHSR